MRVQVGQHPVELWWGELPGHFDGLAERAPCSEQFGDVRGRTDEDDRLFCVSVSQQLQLWPTLLVTQRYSPAGSGFDPGVLVVPETGVVFIGAGERLLAYDLNAPRRLWENTADFGFWWWDRQGEVILMAAELELAAWTLRGHKLWTTSVEPPWSYAVQGGALHLNVMDQLGSFPLLTGPQGALT